MQNKGTDKQCDNRAVDQHFCFRYKDSTISLLLNPKFQASSHFLLLYSPVCVRPSCKPEDRFSYDPAHISSTLRPVKMSRVMRKPDFCICENKDADQLRGNREADQRLCFRYTDSTIPLLSESEISSL